jgi:hypothetical protein
LKLERGARSFRRLSTRRAVAALALAATSAVAPRPPAIGQTAVSSISVRIEDDDGPLLAERYVAVVPVERPWSEPLAEALVPFGEAPPIFELPAGKFRVLCSASGHEFSYLHGLVTTVPGTSQVLPCRVRKLTEVRGTILAGFGGRGPERASIVPSFLAEEEFPQQLSAVGKAHLERNWVAHPDEAGRFVLRGAAGFKGDYWVLAPGFAPVVLPEVAFSAGKELAPVKVVQGGALDLHVVVPPGFPTSRYLVGLRETGRGSAVDVFRKDAVHRLLVKTLPADGAVTFSGLPASLLEVWLKPRRGSDPALLPVSLGKVRIKSGTRVSLTMMAAPESKPVAGPTLRDLRFAVAVADAKQFEDGLRVVRLMGAEVQPVRAETHAVVGGLEIRAQVPCAAGASYIVESATKLAEPVAASPGCDAIAAPLVLHTRAEVQGHFLVPVGMARPRQGVIGVAACGGSKRQPEMSYPLQADAEGDWHAAVVAGCSDLTLRTVFAPITLRGVTLQAAERRHLGSQRLAVGATVLVRVVAGPPSQPAGGTHLDLVPAGALARLVAAGGEGEVLSRVEEEATNPDGWARFGPLAKGSYSVRAMPAGGLAVFSDLVSVEEGEEAVLDDLVLRKPAEVDVVVEGSVGEVAAGSILSVEAVGVEGCGWRSLQRASAPVDRGHKAHLRLNPGPWTFQLVVIDAVGRSRQLSRVRRDLGPGGFAQVRLQIGAAGATPSVGDGVP